MPDHRLQPMTPLGSREPVSVTIGPVTITETDLGAVAWLASRRDGQAKFDAACKRLDLQLAEPSRTAENSRWMTVWIAPGQWLVAAPAETHGDIAGVLKDEFAASASIAEQTDAFAGFALGGERLPDLLERLCLLDVRSMKDGDAARSMIEQIDCHVLHRRADDITLLGPRSFAESLHHALVAAATSAFGD